ncbi:hypothetical protein P7K49_025854 [Saguinus oedipus]|uniref:Uncharacterized protein n=1 Tax=Saguinus oedipus TaxID=9490 RepID=A0ABQ9UJ67_SAGOE|nr:hypothetical protein P7K49_025854 [Saguinus oedipus]
MQTTVVGYNPEKYSVTQLVYSASMDQISAITDSAEYCEQYVSYFCKMSRLLNTPEDQGHILDGVVNGLYLEEISGVIWEGLRIGGNRGSEYR